MALRFTLGYHMPPRWGFGRVDLFRRWARGEPGLDFSGLGLGEWWAGDGVSNPGGSGFAVVELP